MPKKTTSPRTPKTKRKTRKKTLNLTKIKKIQSALSEVGREENRAKRQRIISHKSNWKKFSAEARKILSSSAGMRESMAPRLAKAFIDFFRKQTYRRDFVSKTILHGLSGLIRMAANDKMSKSYEPDRLRRIAGREDLEAIRSDAAVLVLKIAEMATRALRTEIKVEHLERYTAKRPVFPVIFSPHPTFRGTNADAKKLFDLFKVGKKLKYRRDNRARLVINDEFKQLAHELIEVARWRVNKPFCKDHLYEYQKATVVVLKQLKLDTDPELLDLVKVRQPSRETPGQQRQSILEIIARNVEGMCNQTADEDGWVDDSDGERPENHR